MKKLLAIALSLVITATLTFQVGCTRPLGSQLGKDAYPEDYAVAVVRTTEYFESSFIEFYDDDLNLIACIEYPYADLENRGEPVRTSQGVVYIAHRGKAFERQGNGVVGISLATGEATEYQLETPVAAAEATDDYIFGIVDAVTTSYITRIDKNTGEQTVKAFEDCMFGFSAVGHGLLLIADDPLTGEVGDLLVLDESLEEIDRFNLGSLGVCHRIFAPIDNKFYFEASKYDPESGTYASTLNYYSLSDEQIHTVVSDYSYQTLSVLSHDSYLLVTQFDRNIDSANKILILDRETHEVVSIFSLPCFPEFVELRGDSLYISGWYRDAGQTNSLNKYRVEDAEVIKLDETQISTELDELGTKQGSGYFVTGLFFREG